VDLCSDRYLAVFPIHVEAWGALVVVVVFFVCSLYVIAIFATCVCTYQNIVFEISDVDVVILLVVCVWLSVYVGVCACMHVCMHACMFAYIYIFIYVYIQLCMCVY
jgi:hypothetical protein